MNEPLPAALERFKRKERNLLVQAMLGHKEEKPLQLADSFLNKVAGALDDLESIPADAWWATDYHISWLAGALAVLVKGESAVFHRNDDQPLPAWPNLPIPNREGGHSQLVEGNQEDVDLVIATGCELIMIEAKGFDAFDKEPMLSTGLHFASESTPSGESSRPHKRRRAEAHTPRPALWSPSKCVRTHLAVDVASIADRRRRALMWVNFGFRAVGV